MTLAERDLIHRGDKENEMRTRPKSSYTNPIRPDLIFAGIILVALLIGFGMRFAAPVLP